MAIAAYLSYEAGRLDERKEWIDSGYSVREMKRRLRLKRKKR